MLVEIKNGTLQQGSNVILSGFDFLLKDNEKIGIVGRNGAGKTTLLKLVVGEIELQYNEDGSVGNISKSGDVEIGYLKQQLAEVDSIHKMKTAYEYLLSAFEKLINLEKEIEAKTKEIENNYDEKKAIQLNTLIDTYNNCGGNTIEKELRGGFKKFGFSEQDLNKKLNEFSGGQMTKISLLRLLLLKPKLLILDEPTNHLDVDAISWMENYLVKTNNNVLVVSHDRMFLDNVCNVIYDIENKIAVRYEGNYSDFVEQKQINYELNLAKYNKNLKEIERLTALTERFRYKATKAKMVKSKDKVIERIEKETIKPLEADTTTFRCKIIPKVESGREVLVCDNLMVGYGGKVITNVSCKVCRGDRLAIIGANGSGKSTIVKTIVGAIEKLGGGFEYGYNVAYEYFDQKIAEIQSEKTVFDDFHDEFPTYTNTEVRNRLGRFLFTGDDVEKKVSRLSGGEKVRLALSKIFERRPNLLILDEPTNHLDILGKEGLENIINDYTGTVIFVSHDRYFVRKVANKILYFDKSVDKNDGKVSTHFFEFGYEDYEKFVNGNVFEISNGNVSNSKKVDNDINWNNKRNIDITDSDVSKVVNDDANKLDLPKEKYLSDYDTQKLQKKNEKKIARIEDEIAKLEFDIKLANDKLLDESVQTNFEELNKINEEIEKLQNRLDEKYAEWDEMNGG